MCRVAKATLPVDARSPRQARRFVAGMAQAWELDGLGEPLTLLASELVTNAVRYGAGPVRVALVVAEDTVEVAVHDSATAERDPRAAILVAPSRTGVVAALDADGGRGLLIVDHVASRWGVVGAPDGKTVWCTLPLATGWGYRAACRCHSDPHAVPAASGLRVLPLPGPWDDAAVGLLDGIR